MVMLAGTLGRLGRCNVLLAGDFVVDRYTVGKARRISPEAPVAVLHVSSEEQRPGGAGNVALNLVSLGASVSVIGRIGHDTAGRQLRESLEKDGIDTTGLLIQDDVPTPVKNRVIADNQQIVRIDYETVSSISADLERLMIQQISDRLRDIDVVAISDYGKGFLSIPLLRTLIGEARKRGIPVITDPKSTDLTKYDGSTLIKPNLSEAMAASGLSPEASLDAMAQQILSRVATDYLMITRSQAGISIFPKVGERQDFPVKAREVKDVTGAGDTVLATLTCAWANGLSLAEACHLCNISAGIAIERLGCARITLRELAHRLLDLDSGNKIFGQEHLIALQEALRETACALVVVNSRTSFDIDLFNMIRRLGQEEQLQVVIYVEDQDPDHRYVSMLASLKDVSFIIVNSHSLDEVSSCLQPRVVTSVGMGHVMHVTGM